MSTNYYLSFRRALAEGIPTEWLQKIHLAQYAAGGFLLQAIRGNVRFNVEPLPVDLENDRHSSLYWSPVSEIPSVENWEQMKTLISNPDYAIIDEYDQEVKIADFIDSVENQESGTDHRYRRMTEWLKNDPGALFFGRRTDYLDKDGFSFEVGEFS